MTEKLLETFGPALVSLLVAVAAYLKSLAAHDRLDAKEKSDGSPDQKA